MRVYESRTIPEKIEMRVVKRICDLCKAVEGHHEWEGGTWGNVDETQIQVKILQREGYSYPEGGSGTQYDIDVCPNCFKNKLIPWLISQGADIKPVDWDF